MIPTASFFRTSIIATTITATLALQSCTQQQQQSAMVGGLGGAAIGAIAGDDSEDVILGAAIGAAAGTGAAALQEEHNRNQTANQGGEQQAPPAPPAPAPTQDYPSATKTDNPNLVVSPFKPHNVIDVQGFQSGQLARDPSNDQIFRIP